MLAVGPFQQMVGQSLFLIVSARLFFRRWRLLSQESAWHRCWHGGERSGKEIVESANHISIHEHGTLVLLHFFGMEGRADRVRSPAAAPPFLYHELHLQNAFTLVLQSVLML